MIILFVLRFLAMNGDFVTYCNYRTLYLLIYWLFVNIQVQRATGTVFCQVEI